MSSGSVIVTNTVSASISSGSVALLGGANTIGSVKLTDGADTVSVTAGSLLEVSVSSASVVVTNQVSASISNNLTASALQSTPGAAASGWHVRIVDRDGNLLGATGSPLVVSGGAGGTSATDRAVYAEGSTSFTPAGGFFFDSAASLTACQSGAGRITAYRAEHINLRDASGLQLGVSGSPLITSTSAVVTNTVSASISAGSVALLAGANTIGAASAIQGTKAAMADAWPVRIADGSGNQLGVTGSPLVVTGGAGGTSATDQAVYAEGSTSFTPAGGFFFDSAASLTACQSGAVRQTAYRALHVNLRNASGLQLGVSGSPLITSTSAVVTNTVSASISSGSVALLAGANVIGSASVIQSTAAADTAPWPMKLSDGTDTAVVDSASRLTVAASAVVTNTVSASISSGSVALLTGANVIGSASVLQSTAAADTAPWPMKLSDGTDTAVIDSASRLTVAASAVVTNTVSASISSGSVALLTGANVIGSASVIQGTPTGIANAWPMQLTDGTDTAVVDSASRLTVAASAVVTNTVSASISSGSLNVMHENGTLVVTGSILTLQTQDVSASTSGCIIIVSGCQNQKIRVVAMTYSTSGSQRIGWISGSSASTLLQTAMALAQYGGVDVNRMPYGYLYECANGSALVMTTNAASQVSGNLNYVFVPV